MKVCLTCMLPVTAKADDGTGRHKDPPGCPTPVDHDEYLRQRAARLPNLTALQKALAEGKTIGQHIKETEDG